MIDRGVGSIADHVAATPVKRINIGYGEQAIMNTLDLIKGIIIESSKNYYVRRWAEKILEGPPRQDRDRVEKIAAFINKRSTYTKDPSLIEQLKSPLVSLQMFEVGERAMLDCDDYAILAGSLLMSVGIPVALRCTGYKASKTLSHVYLLVRVGDKWVPLDLTRPEFPVGWEPPAPTRIVDKEVR